MKLSLAKLVAGAKAIARALSFGVAIAETARAAAPVRPQAVILTIVCPRCGNQRNDLVTTDSLPQALCPACIAELRAMSDAAKAAESAV